MRARTLLLAATVTFCLGLARGYSVWDAPAAVDPQPEPRTFATIAGVATSSRLYMYGGFSHARNAWLGDLWSLALNASATGWERVNVKLGDLPSSLEHGTLVSLDSALLLVGGRLGDGTWNDKLYLLDMATRQWLALSNTTSVPQLYWHSALSYTYGGVARVLLTGGLNANGSAAAAAYELMADASGGYTFTTLAPMPTPLFGHSLAADPADPSRIIASGGFTGAMPSGSAPREAVPPGLRGALEAAPGAAGSGSSVGVLGLNASYAVLRYDRMAGSGGAGEWAGLGAGDLAMPRGSAFHASWILSDVLYLYGGVQTLSAQGVSAPDSVLSGLQAFTLPTAPATSTLAFAPAAAAAATAAWGAVRPGWVSGAATWADLSNAAAPQLWLFGGWATPLPLPPWADSYLAPQDVSLTWRLDGGATAAAVSSSSSGPAAVGAWLPPLQGGMAPRSGAMLAAVNVGGVRKLLSLGGRAATGWAAATTGGSRFLTNPFGLVFGADGDPRANAAAYQLTDLWLIDAATGAREAVWLVNSTVVPDAGACLPPYAAASLGGSAAATCTSMPFGSATAPAGGAPLWDRRLVESPMPVPSGGAAANGGGGSATGAAGGSNHVIYIQAAETTTIPGGAPSLTAGVWRLSISSLDLPMATGTAAGLPAGRGTVYVATWQELTPAASPDPSPCYPRTLHGAAHLTSTSSAAVVMAGSPGSSSSLGSSSVAGSSLSYVALFGGLLLSPSAGGGGADTSRLLSFTPTDSVCLFDVYYRRWLQPPVYPAGYFPEARYRVSCASRPGLTNYTMSCFGGVSGASGGLLGDAWLFSMQPGALPLPAAAVQLPVHFGTWTAAPHNVTAVRPRARADHLMLPVRGPGLPGLNGSTYSPVLLLGGRVNASTAASSAAPGSSGLGPLRRDLWLLETACADPDANAPNALPSANRPPQTTQVWLALLPAGSATAAAAAAAVPGDAWSVVTATVSHNDTHAEVWMGVLPTGGAVADLRLIRMATTLDGCTSIKPNCTRLSYAYDAVAPSCWAGAAAATLPVRVAAADSPLPTTSLFASGVALQLLAPDGVPVHFKNTTYLSVQTPSGYLLNDVRLPPDVPDTTSLTLVAFGRPGVEIARAPVTPPISTAPGNLQPTAVISFNRTSLTFTVRSNGSALANATAELRVLYNGLYRKRCRVPTALFGDCDATVTDVKGSASFEVFPVPAAQISLLAYVALVTTPYFYGAYAVPLPSPYAVAAGGSSSVTGAGGGTVTLLPGGGPSGTALAYSLDVPSSLAPAPPPDGRLSVTVTVSFRQSIGYSVLNLPTNRRWVASFYRRYSFGSLDPTPSLNISDTYSIASKPYARRLAPGEFLVWVTDAALPSRPMLETVRTVDAAAAAAAGGSTNVNLEVVLSTVTFRLFFSRVVVSPGAGFYVGASSVFVSLYTIPEDTTAAAAIAGTAADAADAAAAAANSTGANSTGVVMTAPPPSPSPPQPQSLTVLSGSTASGSPGVPWDSELTDGGLATFSVIPGIDYLAVFSYPSVVLRGPVTITAPSVSNTLPGGGSSGTGSGSGGASTTGGGAVFDYELPQALLCATGTTTLINQQRGRFPSDSLNTVVYGPGTTCSWVITTGQPVMNLLINYTGLAPGDYITLTTDTGFVTRLPTLQLDSSSVFTIRMTASNVTIRFRGNNDNLMGTGPVVIWEGVSQRNSMPPQFIMMIAASSAAAGAMLLFLCLWHCVFRPVQLRRQAAAAAFAAAASAAAAGAAGAGAAGAGMRGAQGHRNRVPRRYLRMMDTSVYSAKEAAARAAAKAKSTSTTVATALPVEAEGGVAVGVPVPSAAVPPGPAADGNGIATKAEVVPGSAVRAGAEMPPSPDGEANVNAGANAGGIADALAAAAGITAAAADMAVTNATANSGSSSAGDGATSAPTEDGVDGADTCAICLCDFEEGERVKHLPCKHFYHIACIDTWLGRDITCPLCKDNVLEAMRTLHGPLPPRASGRQGRGGAAAAAAASAEAEAAAAAAGAVGGGEGGAGAAGAGAGAGGALHAGHLELVVVVPSEGQAGGADGSNGAAGDGTGGTGGGGHDAPGLPGSIESYHASLDTSLGAHGGSGGGAAPTAEGGSAHGAAPVTAAAAAAGGQELHTMSTAQSRELRPMRRNLSHDLGGEHDGTTTETDSDSDDDHGAAAAAAMGAAAAAAGAGQPRNPSGAAPWAVAPPSPAGTGAGAGTGASPHGQHSHAHGHGHHHGRQVAPGPPRGMSGGAPPPMPPPGNQLFATPPPAALQLAAMGGGGGGMAPAGSPGSRPVAEHVQRSNSSSTTAMRWMGGGGSQVAPMPMLTSQSPSGASGGGAGLGSASGRYTSRVPPQARAQEAQMAAAAAALSAAAAATSGGSYSYGHGNGGGGVGSSTGGYSPRRLLEDAGAPKDSALALAMAAAAGAASMVHFRVHDNPLARSQNSLSAAAETPQAASTPGVSGGGSELPSPARQEGPQAAAGVPGPPAGSTTLRSSASSSARSRSAGGGGMSGGQGQGQGQGGSVRTVGALAVPDVSGDDGDLLRTPSGQRAAGGAGGAAGGGGTA
ncbi:hypothetical protein CHLRE_16g651400v5 [Chlamydomonas reinhardtii]|uniref:RING-type domain-containing protein n=1 Tax=Chlamydomonas reinhardtii TaxID=3055 RepID=A0A2K3CSW4_CHLRE|nr:uncharacterized protein CHLRE_16g651400v5 [Chlamydomonas reinhardtii]PNW71369.1 hypothetical protein CHLRE_16g651400v5 [Chlamydomonas reinhardtii]